MMPKSIVRISVHMDNLLQITNDGQVVNLFLRTQDVPVGAVGFVVVKDVDEWKDFAEAPTRDTTTLRLNNLSKLVVQK